MKRGDFYLVPHASKADPKRQRVVVVVSRQTLIDSNYSSVICAPVYSSRHGIGTQVAVGIENGLKKESSIHCDELLSLPKRALTHYVGSLQALQTPELDLALAAALDIEVMSWPPY